MQSAWKHDDDYAIWSYGSGLVFGDLKQGSARFGFRAFSRLEPGKDTTSEDDRSN